MFFTSSQSVSSKSVSLKTTTFGFIIGVQLLLLLSLTPLVNAAFGTPGTTHTGVSSSTTTTGHSWSMLTTTTSVASRRLWSTAVVGGLRSTNTFHRRHLRSVLYSTTNPSSSSNIHSNNNNNNMSSDNTKIPTNAELVERRLQTKREKDEAKQRSIDEKVKRNLQLKRMMSSTATATHNNNNGTTPAAYPIPSLYAVRVSVDEQLREELRLNGREKRGRVFIEQGTRGTQTLTGLRHEIHSFFRCLRKSTFVLSGGFPVIVEGGSITSPTHPDTGLVDDTHYWPITTDEQVVETFIKADKFFEDINNKNTANKDQNSAGDAFQMKRPSILIHVTKDPNAPPPETFPYLENMEDPTNTTHMTMLSFYSFPPKGGIDDPEEFAQTLRKRWKPFGALGRVYVAQEGVNAQMSIPTNVIDNFVDCCTNYIPELGVHMENGINIDPKPLTMEEFQVAGVPVRGQPAPPFRGLHVRVRNQIVADGLDRPLDWESAGYDMPPLEWHAQLKKAKEATTATTEGSTDKKKEDIPIILDCRNTYETDVGIFDGAEPLNTENFRDSWDVLKERLQDTPKDAPIMTYCTGGIRCVKVGAYLTQEMGFKNVSRLAGGIIAYDRTLNEKAAEEEPLFKGTNFVFDGRLGRAITEDALGSCITCGAETSLVSNCRNDNCHKRMIQCEKCKTTFLGTCSDACQQRVMKNQDMAPRRAQQQQQKEADEQVSDAAAKRGFETIEEYSAGHSTPPPSFYREIEFNTQAHLPSGSHMVSGASQGRWLTHLASTTREGRVLELGTFTGYATACFLEGAANAGEGLSMNNGNREGGPFVMTLERDQRAIDIAVAHLNIMSEVGVGEEAAEAACALRSSNGGGIVPVESPVVSLPPYKNIAGCEVVKVTDALATIEEMAEKNGDLNNVAPFDIVFVDADKTRMLEYVEACLINDNILKKGGLIIIDNVLWKGLVLEAHNGEFVSEKEEELGTLDEREIKKGRRARKLANKMHYFNSEIVKDDRVEVVVLPMRDGLSIIRKR